VPALHALGMLGFASAIKWKLRRHAWFGITVTILAAFHVPLVLFSPRITNRVPAIATAVINSADFVVILAIVSIVGREMNGPQPAE